MAQNYQKLNIEINEPILSIVTAVQNDTESRFLDVQLFDGGVPIDLTGHIVRIKADSDPRSNANPPVNTFDDGTILDAETGRCVFALTTDMLAQTGALNAQISVWNGESQVLSTQSFVIYVHPSQLNEEQTTSRNEYGVLVVLFSEIQNALEDLHNISESIGTPSQESIEAGLDTFWKVNEKSISLTQELRDVVLATDASFGPGEYEFTFPKELNILYITACGGGGGGASGWKDGSYDERGGGGGGGGAAISEYIVINPPRTINITVGRGGKGGDNSPGEQGGTTIIGDIITLGGGGGGGVNTSQEYWGAGSSGGNGGGQGGPAHGGNVTYPMNGSDGLFGDGGKAGQYIYGGGGGGGGGSIGYGGNGSPANTTSDNVYTEEQLTGKNGGLGAGGGGGGARVISSVLTYGKGGDGGDGFVYLRW